MIGRIQDLVRQELTRGARTIGALVAGVTPDEARRRPSPEAWSLLEVVCHLEDEECLDFRPRLDSVLHRPGEPWAPIDPAGWVTARRYNERDLGEALRGFLAERERSLAWLDTLAAPDWSREHRASFGPITAGDLLASRSPEQEIPVLSEGSFACGGCVGAPPFGGAALDTAEDRVSAAHGHPPFIEGGAS